MLSVKFGITIKLNLNWMQHARCCYDHHLLDDKCSATRLFYKVLFQEFFMNSHIKSNGNRFVQVMRKNKFWNNIAMHKSMKESCTKLNCCIHMFRSTKSVFITAKRDVSYQMKCRLTHDRTSRNSSPDA